MNNIALAETTRIFDVEAARRHFPILTRMIHGKPLVYLDNGASAQPRDRGAAGPGAQREAVRAASRRGSATTTRP